MAYSSYTKVSPASMAFIPRHKVLDHLKVGIPLTFGNHTYHNSMEKLEKNEKLIGKLIEKRKKENDAFFKLLNALGGHKVPENKAKNKKKLKP